MASVLRDIPNDRLFDFNRGMLGFQGTNLAPRKGGLQWTTTCRINVAAVALCFISISAEPLPRVCQSSGVDSLLPVSRHRR